MLYRFYGLLLNHLTLQDRFKALEAASGGAGVGGDGGEGPTPGLAPPGKDVAPSAPPLPLQPVASDKEPKKTK